MGSKKIIALIGGIVVLVLVLAASSVGADALAGEDEGEIEERGTRAMECFDDVWCNSPSWAIRVTNPGAGHGIWAKTQTATRWKAALYGEATDGGCGVSGTSNWGDGVRGYSTSAVGGRFSSANSFGVRINSSGASGIGIYNADHSGLYVHDCVNDGVHVRDAGRHGVYVDNADNEGVYVKYANDHGVRLENSGLSAFYVVDTGASGVYVKDADKYGLYVKECGQSGVYVEHAEIYGGYFNGKNLGVRIKSEGALLEAYDTDPTSNRRFVVTNNGNVYADGTFNPGGADFCEMLPAVEGLEPADVLVVNREGELARSSEPYATSVVGVYSTKPGFVGGWDEGGDMTGKVPLAVVGVVPVKASAENGAIQPGDLLATSSTPGHAMKATETEDGTLIGKALGRLEAGTGTIQMLVTLH